MLRRISTKLLLAVLAAVVIPFLGFAWFVDRQMAQKLSRDVVLDSLRGLATDLASQIDRDLEGHARQVQHWSNDRICEYAIDEAARDWAGVESRATERVLLGERFDEGVLAWPEHELLLLVDARGRFVVSSNLDSSGEILPESAWEALRARDWAREPWFAEALAGKLAQVDQHRSSYLPDPTPDSIAPEDFAVGYAVPVFRKAPLDGELGGELGVDADGEPPPNGSGADPRGAPIGVLFAQIDWKYVQDQVSQPLLKTYFQGLVGTDGRPSAYAWIWRADGDTIIAHERAALYGKSVSRDLGLAQMTSAVQGATGGLYPEYEFVGKRKNAAFRRCAGPERAGFGWIVGVGIDNDDIYRGANELRTTLLQATAIVLLVAVLWTMAVARRTTAPIQELEAHTRRIARGDLDARVPVKSRDELGRLARSFNQMSAQIKESRDKLVKAEKDAAWREMARQVAHDIKNPLTPIQLSLDLLKRARREGSRDFDAIFERTSDTISRQVAHLREIASDFNALTGTAHAKPERVDAAAAIDEVLDLHAAWAQELGVVLERNGADGALIADPKLLRRVFTNLVSNALQAMPDGGRLTVTIDPSPDRIAIEIRDSGVGLPDEVKQRLFEPYFTTRSQGTGLGLAIAKRVLEEMGGTIALDTNAPDPGTRARITLPRAHDPSP